MLTQPCWTCWLWWWWLLSTCLWSRPSAACSSRWTLMWSLACSTRWQLSIATLGIVSLAVFGFARLASLLLYILRQLTCAFSSSPGKWVGWELSWEKRWSLWRCNHELQCLTRKLHAQHDTVKMAIANECYESNLPVDCEVYELFSDLLTDAALNKNPISQ